MLHLPVNIGAPAARNWLLRQPEAEASAFAVFLDDDVVLPPRWLRRLLGAAQGNPEAGAAGCRIVSATPPPCLQSADYQLFAPANEARTFRDMSSYHRRVVHLTLQDDEFVFTRSKGEGSMKRSTPL